MVSEKLVKKWLDENLINKKQADKMLLDIKSESHESTSSKLIIAFSTLGVLLVGIAAILFVGSNWQQMSNIAKFLILITSTFIVYFFGYYFRYQKNSFPRVGDSLIFLSGLLFGATVILTAQMYHWTANTHFLLLIWMIGIIPLVYMYKNKPIAALFGILFLLWIGFFIFRGYEWAGIKLIPTYFVVGSVMMTFGAYHYLVKGFEGVGRMYRLLGLKVMVFTLFLLTFKAISRTSEWRIERVSNDPTSITFSFLLIAFLSLASMIYWLTKNPAKIKTSIYENSIGILLLFIITIFFFYPTTSYVYVIIFNLIFAGILVLLLYLGNTLRDVQILNLAILYIGIFIFAKYFDFFYSMLESSLFFLIGGVILVVAGIYFEKKRRVIKETFGEGNDKQN